MNAQMGAETRQTLHRIASLAIEAMLYEVAATPKPGLVDRNNCGAHKDMDFFTFMSSASALHASFDVMTQVGFSFRDYASPKAMWPKLRKAGVEAEKQMFEFTRGVNTHKGEIFSLGLLCGCAGWQIEKDGLSAETLMDLSSVMCAGFCEQEFSCLRDKDEKSLTKGERMYLKHGCTGIRGEAESGYATVRNVSLPVLRQLMEQKVPINDALVQTLLYLIAKTSDTNIIARHDMKTAEYARAYAQQVIDQGGIFTEAGRRGLEAMDRDFIERYISPGGCSDLLAVTYFLFAIENDNLKGDLL